jgi:hypothetical protein
MHFRMKMAERALDWSWTEIDIDGTATDFLQELERAQFFTVGFHHNKEERLAKDSEVHRLPEGFIVRKANSESTERRRTT